MKKLIAASVIALGFAAPALAQHTAPMMSAPPAGKTITDYYKQAVYDPSQSKLGSVDDVLINDQGQVTALVIGVGGVAGVGQKDVIVAFKFGTTRAAKERRVVPDPRCDPRRIEIGSWLLV